MHVLGRNTMCAPRFVQRLKNTTVREHETVTLEADCEGVPVPMMSWQKDNRMIPVNDDHYRIDTNEGRSTLYINDASPTDSAWYQCTAASRAGTASNRMRLIVQGKDGVMVHMGKYTCVILQMCVNRNILAQCKFKKGIFILPYYIFTTC